MDIDPGSRDDQSGRRHVGVATPGGMKLTSHWQGKWPPDGGRVGRPTGRSTSPVTTVTPKARPRMRWTGNALPWDELDRLTLLTLTYPADWHRWCPDGTTFNRRLRAFRERWCRRWGVPPGARVLEFQPRALRPAQERFASHSHLYVDLPEDPELCHDGNTGGEVWDWARQAWWEIVTSDGSDHRSRSVHARPCFDGTYESRSTTTKRVGDGFWRESDELSQKAAPDGFDGVMRRGVWGMAPVEGLQEVDEDEFVKVRRMLRR